VSLPRGTYSIVACDAATGEVGVAVQSKYFCVGHVVPWAKAGVGAVATQAAGVAAYGPKLLFLLGSGYTPEAALEEALAEDAGKETRQLGVVDMTGRAAAFTGAECNDWAGHLVGEGYAVQGNILASQHVVDAMARAYEQVEGPLAERLMAALEAGQEAGGDKRGQQSAALLVERLDAGKATRDGIDKIVDLRVDDHEQPIAELRRLLGIRTRWDTMLLAYAHAEVEDYDGAVEVITAAVDAAPDDALLLYSRAGFASRAGRRDTALADLRRSLELDRTLLEQARTAAAFEALADDDEFRALVAA
jgi:uncharacterized Ntn-hydrolase superfamily protein